MKKLIALLLSILLLVGLFAGCGQPASSVPEEQETEAPAAAPEETKDDAPTEDAPAEDDVTHVGVLVSLSGTTGAWAGQSVIDGMKLSAKILNENGGVLGTTIDVQDRDDEGTVATMSSEFEKLVSNYNIKAAFGVTTGNVSTPFNEALSQYNLPGVQFGGLMIDVNGVATGSGYPTKFNMASCDDTWALTGYDYCVNDMGCKKLYLIGKDGITTDENASIYLQMAEMDGIEIVAVDGLPDTTNDFNAEILKVLSSDADCCVCLDGSDFGANFAKQAYELGLMDKMPLFFNGIPGIETMKVLPQNVLQKTYWGGDFYYSYESEATQAFVDAYRAEYGDYPADYAYYGYAALRIWAEAVERAGTFDTDAVVAEMKNTSGDFGAGDMSFTWANNCQGTYYILTGKTDEELAAGDEGDFMKILLTKNGADYIISEEEAAQYPIVLSKDR